VSILGLTWPRKTKKGRTVESYYKNGHVRVKCLASGSPVTGEIENHTTPKSGDGSSDWPLTGGKRTRWTQCPECRCRMRVTGPLAHPRLTHHAPQSYTVNKIR
jgi:hypothetical protein